MPTATLAPPLVWKHFATLCAIPRPSKHEARLRQHLADWAESRGLRHEIDAAGNLLLRKPATPGCEAAPTLALQAHLDMVCQARSGIDHDFLQVPIRPRVDGDWLLAETTTLGADNGIGVALALAAMEDETLRHGPLEVLLTVDEEAGMGGAHGLQPGWLGATLMLNLDTEEWGEFYLGCAGGCDVNVSATLPTTALPEDLQICALKVGGLRGGHSGCDIHLQRGNANRLLAEAIRSIAQGAGESFRLIALSGGTARNALPREAEAVIALAPSALRDANRRLDALLTQWAPTLIGDQGELEIRLTLDPIKPRNSSPDVPANPADKDSGAPSPGDHGLRAIDPTTCDRLIAALCEAPYGVRTMSRDFPGVVETSNNLGIVTLANGRFAANLMVRSLRDEKTRQLAETIAAVFRHAGCAVTIDGHYPGWTPNPESPLLALCQRVYRQRFGAESTVQVIHAGLECGIIGAKYPGLDTVSFGPTIRGAHAPGERVEVSSVGRCWTLLRALIEDIGRSTEAHLIAPHADA